jgi:hypothetical protein
MNNIENLINELTIIRSFSHSQDDYRNFTICIEKAKEYLINDYPEMINEAAEKAYPSTVNPDTGNDENWYNKQIWKEGAVWGIQNKEKSYSGKEVSEMMKSSFKAGKRQIQCTCDNEIKTGQTSVMCCNICGKPDEDFWRNGVVADHDFNFLKKIWFERNPVHETNADSGEDMFWQTLSAVIDDYIGAIYTEPSFVPKLIDNETLSLTVDIMRSIIDKMVNIDKPIYSEAEIIIINDSIDRYIKKGA